MGFQVKLSDIIEAIDFQSDEITSYLNKTTGEIVTLNKMILERLKTGIPWRNILSGSMKISKWQSSLIMADDFIGLPA